MLIKKGHLISSRIFIFFLLLFLLVRLPGLGYDISNSDAARWHRRSENFLTALKQKDFKSTYQHYQPGVTLMWLNSFVKQSAFWFQLQYTDNPKTLENADYYPIIHMISKATLVIVLGALFFSQLNLIAKLFSHNTAYFYGTFIIFEPYLVGSDRWFHLTSLESMFGFTSFLFFLLWHKTYRRGFIIFSSVLFVLAVYSKISALLILPVIAFVHMYYAQKEQKLYLREFLLFVGTAQFFFILLFPAIWIAPVEVVKNLFFAIGSAVEGDSLGNYVTGYYGLFYTLVLLFKFSPVLLIFMIFGSLKHKRENINKNTKFVVLYFFTFLIALSAADKKIDRYAITLFPPLILLTSESLSKIPNFNKLIVFVFSALFFVFVTYVYFPVYSAYYSPLFGKNSMKIAQKLNVYDNSGEYYAQAAFYLNTKSRDTNVWVPHNIDSFRYFYKGNFSPIKSESTDFAVTSIDHFDEIFSICGEVDKSFGSKLSDVVYVFKCRY